MIILVLNLGLKSVRCIAFSFDGKVLAKSSKPIRTFVSNERVEQTPKEWVALSWQVIGNVISELEDRASLVRYITVTTSASCLVVLDSEGNPLGNSILVSDTRAIFEARLLANTTEFQSVQGTTGVRSSPDLMLPKMMWLSRHEPKIFRKAAHFLNAGDYLVAKLTGEYVTDLNNAINFHYNIYDNSYPQTLLEFLDIKTSTLPNALPQGTKVGTVLPVIAEELNIPRSCNVVLSTYDVLAAVVGNGIFGVGDAIDMSGTVTSFYSVSDHILFEPHQRISVTPHLVKDRWLVGGSNNLGGGTIEWLKQLLFENETNPYEIMESYALNESMCPDGLIFLPYLLGERTPIWNADCRGVFFGLNRSHSKSHLVRSVFESLGFSVMHIASIIKNCQVPINSVTVAGGLSRLDIINQIKSDILGVPVRKMENFETTSIGAALIALVGAGIFENVVELYDQFCQIEKEYEPDIAKHEKYKDYFQLYLQVYDALRPIFSVQAKLHGNLRQQSGTEQIFKENL